MKLSSFWGIVVLLLGIGSTVSAQDVLITQTGDVHKVYEVEIGGTSIFYKLDNSSEATIHKMDKNQVLMIKYQDGRKVIIGEEGKQIQESPTVVQTQENETEILALNAKFVEEYNQRKVEVTKPANRKAKLLFCTFGLKKDSRLQDNNVKISLQSGETQQNKKTIIGAGSSLNQGILVTVENISPKTVYVDLGNSFFIRDGEASPYYTPSATSTSIGLSGGVSVNLGSVTSALGVGGIAGTLANGVNVGGGKSNSSSTITYAQRIVAIPPKSGIKLEYQKYFFPNSACWKFKTKRFSKIYESIRTYPDDMKVTIGESVLYTEKDKTLSYGVHVAYSLEESCQDIISLNADLYLKEIMGVVMYNSNSINEKYLSPNWKDVLFMVVEN